MVLINNINCVDRISHPSVLSKVALRIFFLNNSQYADPYQISSVSIYRRTDLELSTILDASNLPTAQPLMNFANSSINTSDSSFNVTNYIPGTNASGIYKLGQGQYVVVLDGTLNLSGIWGPSTVIANSAHGVGEYIDIWTVVEVQGGFPDINVNYFRLDDDTFKAVVEQLQIKTSNRLFPQKIYLGSKVDLKVLTDIFVENRNIDDSIKNLFKQSVVNNPQYQITKINYDPNLSSRVIVSSFANTSALVNLTGDDTMILNFDTNNLQGIAGIGNQRGEYRLQVRYNIFAETIMTPEMPFQIV